MTTNRLDELIEWNDYELDIYCDSDPETAERHKDTAYHLRQLRDMQWQPIETLTIVGKVVLLFSELWIDEDFNPRGIREGFRNETDDGPIYSAEWNDCAEQWETRINNEATHWMRRPNPPTGEDG